MTWLAQGGTGSPPAGGGEMSQVIGGTIGAMIVTAAMFYLVLGHRSGRVKLLNTLGLYSERKSGLPPWCALPLAVLSGALLIAVFGMYWDISTHLDAGRDPGPFAKLCQETGVHGQIPVRVDVRHPAIVQDDVI